MIYHKSTDKSSANFIIFGRLSIVAAGSSFLCADAVVGYFGDGSGLKFVGEIVEGSGEFVMTGTLPGCGSGEKKDGHTDLPQVNVGGIDCTRYRDWPLVEIGCRIWTFFLGDGSVKENVAHHHVTFTDMSTIAGERHPNHS